MKNFIVLVLLSIVVGFTACVYDADMKPGQRSGERFSVDDAKAFFEENAEVFKPLSLHSFESAVMHSRTLPVDVQTPIWKTAKSYSSSDAEIVNVPIKSNFMMMVRRWDNKTGGGAAKFDAYVENQFIVAHRVDGTMDMFIANMVPDYSYLLRSQRNSQFLHVDNDFCGYVIISELDGSVREVLRYGDGRLLSTPSLVSLSSSEALIDGNVNIRLYTIGTSMMALRSDDSEAGDQGNNRDVNPVSIHDANNNLSNIVSDPALRSVINHGTTFNETSSGDKLHEHTNYKTVNGTPYSYSISIDYIPEFFESLSVQGQMHALYHEYTHSYKTLYHQPTDHSTFINDPAHLQVLRGIYPGQSEEYYNKIQWFGCDDELEKSSMSQEEKNDIRRFIRDNTSYKP